MTKRAEVIYDNGVLTPPRIKRLNDTFSRRFPEHASHYPY